MTPGLDNIPNRTPDQARAEIARKDRASWYPVSTPTVHHIADRCGAIVVSCGNQRDRDFILEMARSHDALIAALQGMLERYDFGTSYCPEHAVPNARAALALARGEKPSDDELAGAGGFR